MLRVIPTKNLTGVTIQGDFDTFYDIVHSIYNLTGVDVNDNPEDMSYGVKMHLLGLCYDIRHAFMGDRDVFLEKNHLEEEKQAWHGMAAPKENLYYSVNALFPEMIFLALAVPKMCQFAYKNYGYRYHGSRDDGWELPVIPYAEYVRDKANLDVLFAGVWQALSEVIGAEEAEKLYFSAERSSECYMNYATQYVDKCNVDYIKTPFEKRKDKLRNMMKRLIKKPDAYKNMERDLKYAAMEYGVSVYELHDPRVEYPEDVEW